MRESLAINLVTLFVIAGNLVVFGALSALWLLGGFSSSEYKQTILVLTPLAFAYGVPVMKETLQKRHQSPDTSMISPLSFWLTVCTPPLSQFVCLIFISLKAFNLGFKNFDDFMIAMGSVQSIFGGCIGLVISSYFPGAGKSRQLRSRPRKGN